jgi:hypothetical protein
MANKKMNHTKLELSAPQLHSLAVWQERRVPQKRSDNVISGTALLYGRRVHKDPTATTKDCAAKSENILMCCCNEL